MTYTVFVNRKSGIAHRRRDCESLHGVPDGALRRQLVEVETDWLTGEEQHVPRLRMCRLCALVVARI